MARGKKPTVRAVRVVCKPRAVATKQLSGLVVLTRLPPKLLTSRLTLTKVKDTIVLTATKRINFSTLGAPVKHSRRAV